MGTTTPQYDVMRPPAIIKEAQRIEEDATFSSKGHFEAARGWDLLHLWIGIPTSLAAALAGVTALNAHTTVAAILALAVAATSAISTFLNPKERASVHLRAGNAFKSLQNDTRIFREIGGENGVDAAKTVRRLNSCRNKLNRQSPQIPQGAFLRAKKAIEGGQARYNADEGP